MPAGSPPPPRAERIDAPPTGDTFKVIGLVSGAHFFSHFYFLLLPPLFPVLRDAYGVGFTELGLAMAIYSAITALTQAPVGFLVDRYGARALLIGGLVLESISFVLIGVVPTYGGFLLLMGLVGLSNAVYHPADYAILSVSVSRTRMGRAFSFHTFAGYLGQAIAPATILFLAGLTDWRAGLVLCGAAGLVVAALMCWQSDVLRDASRTPAQSEASTAGDRRRGIKLLLSLPVMMGLVFFAGISMSGQGVSAFGVSTLHLIYDAPLADLAMVLSAYLFASPIGVLVGGWIADHTLRHDRNAALCFIVSGGALIAVAAFDPGLVGIAALFVVVGFFGGMVAPSRDMLIRSITPPGDVGKVFGFVTIGFNLSGMVSPLLFGYVLDHHAPSGVFWIAGTVSFLTMAMVLTTGYVSRHTASAPKGAPA